jgi:DNA-binding GntR family transcriptional regulator
MYVSFFKAADPPLTDPRPMNNHIFDQIYNSVGRCKWGIDLKKNAKKTGASKSSVGHTQKAYEGIRKMFFHNEIVPGQKISYRDLAERLNMSQTPIIQALKWFEFKQLVRHKPHRGYYTAAISLQEVEEIYDLRALIELDLLPVTLSRIDGNDLHRLKKALSAHLKASRNVYLYDRLERDMKFHLTLSELSGRKVQHQTLINLFDLLYLKYGGEFLFSSSMDSADSDHQELFEHIERKDLKGSKRVLSRHISRVKTHVVEGVRQLIEATTF